MPESTPSRPVPASRRTRRRTGRLVAALALVTLFAGACVGQQDPTGYSASVREDFVAGCVAGYAPAEGDDPELDHHTELCGCIYDEMSADETGIPFDEFKGAQSAIRKDPTDPANSLDQLIPEFDTFVSACRSKTTVGP